MEDILVVQNSRFNQSHAVPQMPNANSLNSNSKSNILYD